jgi:hypothetical protein
MRACRLVNPHDVAGERGSGPRYILEGDDEDPQVGEAPGPADVGAGAPTSTPA